MSNPYWRQKQKRRETRDAILSGLAHGHLTFTELQQKIGRSRPVLSSYLKQLQDDKLIEKKEVRGKYTAYQITEKAIKTEESIRKVIANSFGPIFESVKKIVPAADYSSDRGVLDLAILTEKDPEMLKILLQWGYDLMALLGSDEAVKWLSKSGTRLNILQAELKKKLGTTMPTNKKQLTEYLDSSLAVMREVMHA